MHLSRASALVLISTVMTATTSTPVPGSTPPEPYVSFFPPTVSPEASVHRLFNMSSFGFENLATRANGQILVTAAFPSAHLWQIDPLSIRPPIQLKEFSSFTATLGITELAPDIFYVVADNSSQPGSGSVFSVNMREFLALPNGDISIPPDIKKVAHLASSVALNGMTHVRQTDDFVLIADTLVGGVWKTNVETGNSTLIIQDPTMKGPPNTTSFASFGINGLRVQNNTLFYTNSGKQSLYRMPVSLLGTSTSLRSSKFKTSINPLSLFSFTQMGPPPEMPVCLPPRSHATTSLSIPGAFFILPVPRMPLSESTRERASKLWSLGRSTAARVISSVHRACNLGGVQAIEAACM